MTTKRDDPLEGELRAALGAGRASSACPSETRWLDLLAGEIAGAEAERLRAHLAECAACAAAARDARRFLHAFDRRVAGAGARRLPRWSLAAAAVLAAGALGLYLFVARSEPADASAVDRLLAAVDLPAPGAGPAADPDLVYRGGEEPARRAALAPYRARRFAAACAALSDHARRYPADREARFFAAVACLEARELDRADELLAALAAGAGERREEARALLARLRRARAEDGG